MQVSEGTADLQRQNLVVSVVEQPSSEAEGTILNQEPAAGTQVRIRSTVRLYVATAMPEVVQDPSISDSPDTFGIIGAHGPALGKDDPAAVDEVALPVPIAQKRPGPLHIPA